MPARGQRSGKHGGSGKCLACALPADKQQELNADLVRGLPLYRLSKRWDINRESLRWHKATHVSPAEHALDVARPTSPLIEEAEKDIERGNVMYLAASAVRNMPLAIKALHVHQAAVQLVAKLRGELDEAPKVVVNFMQTKLYIEVRSILFEELEDYPQVRKRISQRLRVLADSGQDQVGWSLKPVLSQGLPSSGAACVGRRGNR